MKCSTREPYNKIGKYSWNREVMPGRRGNISFGVPAKLNTFLFSILCKVEFRVFMLKKNDLIDCQGVKLDKV